MRKYKSFTAILLTAALVASLTACTQNTAVQPSEASSSLDASGNDAALSGKLDETAETEENLPTSDEGRTETDSTAEEESGADISSETEDDQETEDTASTDTGTDQEERTSADREQESSTKKPETGTSSGKQETTKQPETSKQAATTAAPTATATVKPQSIKASVSGTHYVGDTLTGADFTVTVTMSDGSTRTNPAGWSANPLTLSSTSNQIAVAYEGTSTTITVAAQTRTASTRTSGSGGNGSSGGSSGSSSATTADPHAGMVLADDGQWHETKADGEELQAGDVMWFDGKWIVLGEEFGKEQEQLIADGEYSYEMARILFDMENEVRAEAGSPPLIWSDRLYGVAKQCAKACGDAGRMDHNLTVKYREYNYVTNSGTVFTDIYAENLGLVDANIYYEEEMSWSATLCIEAIKDSPGHYNTLIFNSGNHEEAAVAVFRSGSTLYISYLFHHVDGDLEDIENY